MKLGYDVGLGSMNTFRMNVKTACLAEYDSFGELESFFSDERLSGELPLPFYHIGGGSNLLFTGDFSGTILHELSSLRWSKKILCMSEPVWYGMISASGVPAKVYGALRICR